MAPYKLDMQIKIPWYSKLIVRFVSLGSYSKIVPLVSKFKFFTIYYNGKKYKTYTFGEYLKPKR
jgi:hypothetical protein